MRIISRLWHILRMRVFDSGHLRRLKPRTEGAVVQIRKLDSENSFIKDRAYDCGPRNKLSPLM